MSCLCTCFSQKSKSNDLKAALLDNREDETNSVTEEEPHQDHRRSTSSSASFMPSPFKVSSKFLESPATPLDVSFLRSVKSESPDSVVSPYKTERMERDEPMLNPMSLYSKPVPTAAYQHLEQLRSDPSSTTEALFDAILALIDEYMQQDPLEAAQSLLTEAINLCPLDDHENIPTSTKLAYSCHHLKHYDRAMAILHRNIPVLLQSLGPLHDLTTANLNLLMQIHVDTDSLPGAKSYLDRCLQQQQEAQGESHEYTLNFINFAADINEKMGQWQRASELYSTLLQRLQNSDRSTGKDSAQTLGAMNNLAVTLFQQGQSVEAEKLLRDCWRRKVLLFGSADHEEALTTAQNLVGILQSKGKQDEADEFMVMILAQVKEQEGTTA